jgi:hypothetical protein
MVGDAQQLSALELLTIHASVYRERKCELLHFLWNRPGATSETNRKLEDRGAIAQRRVCVISRGSSGAMIGEGEPEELGQPHEMLGPNR